MRLLVDSGVRRRGADCQGCGSGSQLMSKMAPLVGKDITRRVFMMRFAELCTDALFHVRKVCAANFGDMCTVVGQENTEEFLVRNLGNL